MKEISHMRTCGAGLSDWNSRCRGIILNAGSKIVHNVFAFRSTIASLKQKWKNMWQAFGIPEKKTNSKAASWRITHNVSIPCGWHTKSWHHCWELTTKNWKCRINLTDCSYENKHNCSIYEALIKIFGGILCLNQITDIYDLHIGVKMQSECEKCDVDALLKSSDFGICLSSVATLKLK